MDRDNQGKVPSGDSGTNHGLVTNWSTVEGIGNYYVEVLARGNSTKHSALTLYLLRYTYLFARRATL